ncbi:hypothetical protein CHARACLAT_030985 [Characodon lateralis]|uniref:Uncharacterized protein n=1 Tax=Characodon lateralis TaxID=208331 RepID=A0ABU7EYI4_9TELE|nr:hypothetical protein [Characodon lateralis]
MISVVTETEVKREKKARKRESWGKKEKVRRKIQWRRERRMTGIQDNTLLASTPWGGVAWGPCLALPVWWGSGVRGAAGVLRVGLCVELAQCGCGFIGFSATEFTCGGVPL